jgi:hypothetical protein
MKSGQRLVGIVMLAAGLFFGIAIWGGVLTGARDTNFLELMFPILFSLMAGMFTFRAFRNSVRLTEKSIELCGLSGNTALPFDKIRGRRRYLDKGDENSPSVWHRVLEPNDDRFKKIDIEELYRFDDLFYQWFHTLPDLDELDKTRFKTSNFGLV